MATPYSHQLFAVAGATAGNTAAFTVPANFVAVLRCVDFFLNSSGAAICGLYDTDGATFFATIDLPGINKSQQWKGHQVFPAGHRIGYFVTSGTWNIKASGYLLGS